MFKASLFAAAVAAQDKLQQHVFCNPELDTVNKDAWSLIAVEFDGGAAECETELLKAATANPFISGYTFCAGWAELDGDKFCGYWWIETTKNPVEIREGMPDLETVKSYAQWFVGNTEPGTPIEGTPITKAAYDTREEERNPPAEADADADSASKIAVSVMAFALGVFAMNQ